MATVVRETFDIQHRRRREIWCDVNTTAAVQALQATAAAEAERKANSSKAHFELEEQMKGRQVLQLQQQVCSHRAWTMPAD